MTADVDVLVPVRNGGRLLRRAVDSVLDQEGVDVHVIVVDDGSTDRAPQRLPGDPRLTVIRNRGRGIPDALETAMSAGGARYVTRQDADDESMPGRLAAQVAYLDANPGIGIVGTAFEVIAGKRVLTVMTPSPTGLLDKNPFCAGSVLARREVLEQAGAHRFRFAQDYDMWLRCAAVSGVAILPLVGYRYRLSADMSTIRNASRQAAYAELARTSARARIEGRPDPVRGDEEIDGDAEADLEIAAWWAREFAAVGAWRDALRCLRRLPAARALRLLPQVALGRRPQTVWT